MRRWFLIVTCLLLLIFSSLSEARRTYITADQKAELAKAQNIFLNVIALTERGRQDPSGLRDIVQHRLEQIGYTVVNERKIPHDVEFKVKCEERKTWTGTTSSGGDAELAYAPSRLWKGPACLFTYSLNGKNLGWYKEVRTDFEDSMRAARQAKAKDSGKFALMKLREKLQSFDFPLLVTAEWGQVDRLLQTLEAPTTNKVRKLRILSLLSSLHEEKALNADKALPIIQKFLKDKAFQEEAITALAGTGRQAIPLLSTLFQTSKVDVVRARAAKALGSVGATTGDGSTVVPLLAYLKRILPTIKTSQDIDFPVLTEVVWALGKVRTDEAFTLVGELQKRIWLIYDQSKPMANLREAANWTYSQLDPMLYQG